MKKLNKLFFISFISFSFFLHSEKTIHTSHLDSIVLGSGCFWGAEKGYESLGPADEKQGKKSSALVGNSK